MKSRIERHKNKIIELYNIGLGCPQIKEQLNLKETARTIQRFIKKQGISRTVQEALKLVENKRIATIQRKWQGYNTKRLRRKSINPNTRYKIFKRDNFKCVLCGTGALDGAILNVDHIDSDPSNSDINNYQTLCHLCNIGKA